MHRLLPPILLLHFNRRCGGLSHCSLSGRPDTMLGYMPRACEVAMIQSTILQIEFERLIPPPKANLPRQSHFAFAHSTSLYIMSSAVWYLSVFKPKLELHGHVSQHKRVGWLTAAVTLDAQISRNMHVKRIVTCMTSPALTREKKRRTRLEPSSAPQ